MQRGAHLDQIERRRQRRLVVVVEVDRLDDWHRSNNKHTKGMELVAHSLVCPPLTPELRQRGLQGSVWAGGSRTDELVPVDHLHRLALLVQLVLRNLPLVLLRSVAQSLPCGPINRTGR